MLKVRVLPSARIPKMSNLPEPLPTITRKNILDYRSMTTGFIYVAAAFVTLINTKLNNLSIHNNQLFHTSSCLAFCSASLLHWTYSSSLCMFCPLTLKCLENCVIPTWTQVLTFWLFLSVPRIMLYTYLSIYYINHNSACGNYVEKFFSVRTMWWINT